MCSWLALERALLEAVSWGGPAQTTSRALRAQASRTWAGWAQAGSPVGSSVGSHVGWISSRPTPRSATCSTEGTATLATKDSAGTAAETLAATTEPTQAIRAAARPLTLPPRHRRAMSSARTPGQQPHIHVSLIHLHLLGCGQHSHAVQLSRPTKMQYGAAIPCCYRFQTHQYDPAQVIALSYADVPLLSRRTVRALVVQQLRKADTGCSPQCTREATSRASPRLCRSV